MRSVGPSSALLVSFWGVEIGDFTANYWVCDWAGWAGGGGGFGRVPLKNKRRPCKPSWIIGLGRQQSTCLAQGMVLVSTGQVFAKCVFWGKKRKLSDLKLLARGLDGHNTHNRAQFREQHPPYYPRYPGFGVWAPQSPFLMGVLVQPGICAFGAIRKSHIFALLRCTRPLNG